MDTYICSNPACESRKPGGVPAFTTVIGLDRDLVPVHEDPPQPEEVECQYCSSPAMLAWLIDDEDEPKVFAVLDRAYNHAWTENETIAYVLDTPTWDQYGRWQNLGQSLRLGETVSMHVGTYVLKHVPEEWMDQCPDLGEKRTCLEALANNDIAVARTSLRTLKHLCDPHARGHQAHINSNSAVFFSFHPFAQPNRRFNGACGVPLGYLRRLLEKLGIEAPTSALGADGATQPRLEVKPVSRIRNRDALLQQLHRIVVNWRDQSTENTAANLSVVFLGGNTRRDGEQDWVSWSYSAPFYTALEWLVYDLADDNGYVDITLAQDVVSMADYNASEGK